jgi:hypothetical protein
MITKICKICGEEKDIEQYHKHKGSKDGYINECKSCAHLKNKEYKKIKNQDLEWVKNEREKGRNRQRENLNAQPLSEEQRLDGLKRAKEWKQRNLLKTRAECIAWRLYKNPSEACENCNIIDYNLVRHHPNYLKPKEIIWVCSRCHGILHRKSEKLSRGIQENTNDALTIKEDLREILQDGN